jgi:Ni/Co efflux regulator RcnB
MKRPVTLLLVAALFTSGAAFAKDTKERIADRVAHSVRADQHRDNRDNRNERRDDRGHDRREDRRDDRAHDRRDERRDDRRHDRRDDRRDDYRNEHRPSPPRHDNDRHDWDRRDRNGRDWDRRNDRPNHGGWDRPRADWNRHPNYWDNRRHDRRDYARYRYHYGSYYAPRGYYYRSWHRGDRLPRSWYGSSYIVYDWRPYRLYSPPYGYHWVRVGDDVVLTAIATGIVLDVIYDIWY